MTKFTASAAAFIRGERTYLRKRSRAAASRFVTDIAGVARLLDEYPLVGTELVLLRGTPLEGIRRWVKGNYIFDYELSASGEAIILVVRHHAQDDPFFPYEPTDESDI